MVRKGFSLHPRRSRPGLLICCLSWVVDSTASSTTLPDAFIAAGPASRAKGPHIAPTNPGPAAANRGQRVIPDAPVHGVLRAP